MREMTEKDIAGLIAEMTLAEKIGQLCQVQPHGRDQEERVRDGLVGSLINVVGDDAYFYQSQAVEHSRLRIPLLLGRDVIHGFATVFPIPLGQAASFDPDATTFRAWVLGIAKNVLLESFRKLRRTPLLEADTSGGDLAFRAKQPTNGQLLAAERRLERDGFKSFTVQNRAATPFAFRLNLAGKDNAAGVFERAYDTFTLPGNATVRLRLPDNPLVRTLTREALGTYAAGPAFALLGMLFLVPFDAIQANATTGKVLLGLVALCPGWVPKRGR